MKKTLIGAIVGGLILFIWQFLSWAALNLHASEQAYTPNQDAIMKVLDENLEPGQYFLPTVSPGTSAEAAQEHMTNQAGKPWAQVFYHKSYNANMGMNMTRGVLVDIIAIWMLCWIILKMGSPNMQTIVLTSVFVGLIGFISETYTNSIWFENHVVTSMIDAVVSYGLVGVWLGWWLRK